MVDVLTSLGRALCEYRRKLGKVMGHQSEDTGRSVSEISAIERGILPLPNDYVEEFAAWAGLDESNTELLQSLSRAAPQPGQSRSPAAGRKSTSSYVRAVAAENIRVAAARIRRAAGLTNEERLSILRLAEHGVGGVLPDYEFHVEPAGQMGNVEAYVAEFPLRMVVSDEVYQYAFDHMGRANFTLAHELGHLAFHGEYLKHPESRAARTSGDLSKLSRYEQQADQFAADLLLPEEIVRAVGPDPEALSQLCGVSKSAAENRLRAFGLWPRKSERVIAGFAKLLAELKGEQRSTETDHRKRIVRVEPWGSLVYDFSTDEFRAEVRDGQVPIPRAPIGMGWVIIGACNQECVMCYGNAEELPKGRLSLDESMRVVQAIKDAEIVRVVISGGEPLLYPGIFEIVDGLVQNGTSVVMGTNGTYVTADNAHRLRKCTRVEISLDAADPGLNNRIRDSRKPTGDAWKESVAAIKACLAEGVKVRVLTTLNALNQHHLLELADLLHQLGVDDWALSWTVPAGRAVRIYDQLRPSEPIIQEQLRQVRRLCPTVSFRYSNRSPEEFDRFYFLVLPDGQIATQSLNEGRKVTFGSALEIPLLSTWNQGNFDLEAHFAKWVATRSLRSV